MTWHATMIAPDADHNGAPILYRRFALESGHGDVRQAQLHVTAHGIVEPWLNGTAVTDDLFTPGWTSYEWRLRYATYDVRNQLVERSVLALALGNGWYRGRLGWMGGEAIYGSELAGFAELHIEYEDGYSQIVSTDENWSSTGSNVTSNDFYDGQTVDARLDTVADVSRGGVVEGSGVHAVPFDTSIMARYTSPPVRRIGELEPARAWRSPTGGQLFDFGENLVGWVRLRVTGHRGSAVTIRHAEVLENDDLGTRPLRSAAATDHYILSGGDDVFEPTFTLHGFRYIEVSGDVAIGPADLTAVIVATELRRTGSFRSSNPLLNQFHENAMRGMRGNFVDVPTDCPQRDERMGWTGDLAVFAPTAAFLYDVSDFLKSWLRDLAVEQAHRSGVVPFVVPDVLKYMPPQDGITDEHPVAIWSDAAAWVPWALWQAYGDRHALAESYPAIAAHVRTVRDRISADGVWDQDFQFGDWLDPDAPAADPTRAKADPNVIATASAYRTATIAAEMAAVLGHDADVAEFTGFAEQLRVAFNRHYVNGGIIRSDSTAVYAVAIAFGILDDDDRTAAGARLAELVAESGYRISTGFAGTPFINDALTLTGHLDVAYRLMLQTDCPSWLYPVTMGATTIWERWDSMLPDGSINPGEMTSFNHYALGAVADWLHRTVGGLAPLKPGYREVMIAPQPGGGITAAETTIDTRFGLITVRWSIADDLLDVWVTLPEGVDGVVRLPGTADQRIGSGTSRIGAAARPSVVLT